MALLGTVGFIIAIITSIIAIFLLIIYIFRLYPSDNTLVYNPLSFTGNATNFVPKSNNIYAVSSDDTGGDTITLNSGNKTKGVSFKIANYSGQTVTIKAGSNMTFENIPTSIPGNTISSYLFRTNNIISYLGNSTLSQ